MSRKELTKDKDMACKIILVRMPKSGVSGNTKLEQKTGITAGWRGVPYCSSPTPPLARQAACSLCHLFLLLNNKEGQTEQWRRQLASERSQVTKELVPVPTLQ